MGGRYKLSFGGARRMSPAAQFCSSEVRTARFLGPGRGRDPTTGATIDLLGGEMSRSQVSGAPCVPLRHHVPIMKGSLRPVSWHPNQREIRLSPTSVRSMHRRVAVDVSRTEALQPPKGFPNRTRWPAMLQASGPTTAHYCGPSRGTLERLSLGKRGGGGVMNRCIPRCSRLHRTRAARRKDEQKNRAEIASHLREETAQTGQTGEQAGAQPTRRA